MSERDAGGLALERAAAADPALAARAVLMSLPAVAARVPQTLRYDLSIDELGTYRVSVADGRARVDPVPDAAVADDGVDFRLSMDARTLVELAAGSASPLRMALRGRVRIRGKRRRARQLRALGNGAAPTMAEVLEAGGRVEPDVIHRLLPYGVDPAWTAGHRFTVRYEIAGDGGGSWWVSVRDGEALAVAAEPPEEEPVATVRLDIATYVKLVAGDLTPTLAMQRRLTDIEGEIAPVTLLGRWIERAAGRDDAEMQREREQRELQATRTNVLAEDGAGAGTGGGGNGSGPGRGELLSYRQLYSLWERQNWRASELDFTVDREQWVITPTPAQESTIWSLGSFYVGEERVTADLAPFLAAAPSGEIELFLATQLVDEARHAAFFDRFGAEVMCLSADDLRGRMAEVQRTLLPAWGHVFDDGLRDVSRRILARPDDLDLFVEGIATYHLVIEGFLAVSGQTLIRDYMLDHGLYPGFCEGFGLVERDEHRHVAFGVRFLQDAIASDARHRDTIERVVTELAPRAAHVFVPPYADDPSDFASYGYHSSEVYGHAYRALERKMGVLGLELPPPEELMPGPIDRQLAAPAG